MATRNDWYHQYLLNQIKRGTAQESEVESTFGGP